MDDTWKDRAEKEWWNNPVDVKPVPNCPKCKNNRQVWINQITGKLTCHRAWCHTVIEEEGKKCLQA